MLFDSRFQRVNRIFVLSFGNGGDREIHTGYYLPKVETKYYNVMTDRKNFCDGPVKNDIRTYDNIQKISTHQGDDYTTRSLLNYHYFKTHY